ncbi:lytic murein transglycosylase [Oryzihumus leptocrescens]|uniref:Transglycosylase protein with SLT domain n=1 Tax=Oryzihumus leptocrescens TaxID=297536 RepID=A0A542ZMZ1_9MICO|nr:lytic murein transglycosylase [Oryzihumus leptocrescens]TQL61639.1 transglycosylase protein with SLT domain [Oryzihumus leptocrescens]
MRRRWPGSRQLALWAATVLVLGAGTDREVVLGLSASPPPRAGAPAAAPLEGLAVPGATWGMAPGAGFVGAPATRPQTRRAALPVQPASWSEPTGGPALPARLLAAYRRAVATAPPGCHLPVTLLEAVGQVESGSLTGRSVDADGRVRPAVVGPVLDGAGFAAIRDTDGGRWDGDPIWDRAVGPMQFIPGTWLRAGVDADGDGRADPQDVDDAAAAAAAYLCSHGRDLARAADLRAAVLAYNHSGDYLTTVLGWMRTFGEHGVSVVWQPEPLSPPVAAGPARQAATSASATPQPSTTGSSGPATTPGRSTTPGGTPTGSPTGDPGGTPTGTPSSGTGDASTCQPTPTADPTGPGDLTGPGDTPAPVPTPTEAPVTAPAAAPTTVPDGDAPTPTVTDPCPTSTPMPTGTPAPADGSTAAGLPTPANAPTSGAAPVEPTGAGT